MKKILMAMGALLLWEATTYAQVNPCVAGSGTNCTSASGDPFTITSGGNWPMACFGQTITIIATPTTGLAGLEYITQTNEDCSTPSWIVPLSGSDIVQAWWVATNSGTGYRASGTNLTAVFTPTVCGTGTITFYMIYNISPPCVGELGATNEVSITNNFTVVSVASLGPTNAAACGAILLTSNATLQTFIVPVATTGPSNLVLLATSCPTLTPSQLPSCWTLNGVTTNLAYVSLSQTNFSTNICSAGTSSITNIIQVGTRPSIVTQPASRTNYAGDNVSFSVVATGTAPLHYQWQFDGTNIAGATGTSLAYTDINNGQAGAYTVVVTNILGSVTSSNAILTVQTPPYTALNGPLTNFTFQCDTTYYINAEIDLYGTTTFEGGTVIKFATNSAAELFLLGSNVVCKTGPYRPAIFTAKDDNSVGLPINGSTGNPTNYYGGTGIKRFYESGSTPFTWNYFRFSFLQQGMNLQNAVYSMYDMQFINCQEALYVDTVDLYVRNSLFYHDATNFFCNPEPVFLDLQNVTVDQKTSACFCYVNGYAAFGSDQWYGLTGDPPDFTLNVTNCLLVGTGGLGTNFPYSAYPANTNVFQTVGAGGHYLATNTYRGAGTTNIDANLLAELRFQTTYPPAVFSNAIQTSNLNLFPQTPRDTNSTLDLGYHYDPLDYAFGGIQLSNAVITVNPGTAIGIFAASNIFTAGGVYGLALANNAQFICTGTPTALCRLVSFDTVQEAWGAWSESVANLEPDVTDGPPGPIQFRFTDWSVLGGTPNHYDDNAITGCPVSFTDCQFHGGQLWHTASDVFYTNCLFERVNLGVNDDSGDNTFGFTFRDNLCWNGELQLIHSVEDNLWVLRDNAFNNTVISIWDLGVTNSNNGYVANCSRLTPTNGTDVIVTSMVYQTSWLGNYYQPTNSPLIDKGSTNADVIGLCNYTTQTNQVKETNSVVDIGFHYVALNTNGIPDDSDGDGIPDYLESCQACLPVITYSPTNQTCTYGGSSPVFTVQATGSTPLYYQWRMNGSNIAGATSSGYMLMQPAVADSGTTYSVFVTNRCGIATSSNATLTVLKAPLTIRADNKAKMYHMANPVLTWTATGFFNGDGTNVLTGSPTLSTTATSNSNAGTYTITINSNTLSAANYSLIFTNGILSIVKAPLVITAQNQTRAYGSDNAAFTWTVTGFVNGEGTNVLSGAPSFSTVASNSTSVGAYAIIASQGTLSATNYSFGFVNGTLTVTQAALTLSANNASRIYGAANPAFSAVYSGFVNGDTASVVSGVPSLATTAVSNTLAGNYTITASLGSLSAANYSFTTFNNGSLSISAAPLLVSADNKTTYVGAGIPTLTYTFIGLVAGDGSNAISGAPALSTVSSNNATNIITPYTITNAIGTLVATNYSFTLSNGLLTVLPPSSLITFSNSSMNYLLGSPPAVMDSGMTVVAEGSTTFSNATMTASFVSSQPGDRLSVLSLSTNAGQINVTNITNSTYQINYGSTNVASFTIGSPTNDLVVQFRTNATVTHLQAVARCLTYYNTGTNPYTDERHVKCYISVTNTHGGGWTTCPPVTNTITPVCPTNIYVMIVIDKTSSMTNTDVDTTNAYGATRLASAKYAAVTFLSYLQFPVDKVYAIAFCGETNQPTDPTNVTSGFQTNLVTISNAIVAITNTCADTVYHPSLTVAYTNLATITNAQTLRLVIFLTDGQLEPANTNNYNLYEALALAQTHAMATNGTPNIPGIRIVTIGLGGDVASTNSIGQQARALLTLLASSPDDFHISTNGTGLTSVYTGLATSVCRATNLPPVVNAGPDTTNIFANLPGTVSLAGSSYDPNNPPHTATNFWTKISGPTNVTFSNAALTNSTATFSLPGTNTLQLVATDTYTGLSATDTVNIIIQLIPTAAPTAYIVTPINGQSFNAPAKVTLNSVVHDTAGVVTNLWYYTNGVYWQDSTNFPYQLTLSNLPAGGSSPRTIQFTAVAFSTSGLTGTSAPVTISIIPQPPTVAIVTPQSNADFALNQPIPIQATAGDVDGVVTNVQFRAGTFVLGNVTSAPYMFTWTNGLQTSSTNLYAVATDNNGLSATSSVPVTSQSCAAYGVSNLVLSVSQIGGGGQLTGTVTLSNAATSGGEAVNIYSSDTLVPVPLTVLVPAGSNSINFPISTQATRDTHNVTVSAAYHGQSLHSASLVVTPDSSGVGNGGHTPGQAKWAAPVPTRGVVDGSPAIGNDGSIYITSHDGYLYSINPTTGVTNWSVNVNNTYYYDRLSPSPAIATDGTIYVCSSDGNLYAVNPDGSFKWPLPTQLGQNTEGSCTPAIASDGTIYATLDDETYLFAVNPDGTMKWIYDCGDDLESSPTIGSDCSTIYFWTGGDDSPGGTKLFAVNDDGQVVWSNSVPLQDDVYDYTFAPVIGGDGTIYLSWEYDATSLIALNPDGTPKWEFYAGGPIESSPVIGMDGTIYVGSLDNNLYAINPVDGSTNGIFPTGGSIQASPAVALDGTIYVGSSDNNMYAFSPSGTTNWMFPTGGIINSSPAVASNGTVYFGSDDENVYAVYGSAPLANSAWAMFCKNISHTESQCSLPGSGPVGSVVFVRDDVVRNYGLIAFSGTQSPAIPASEFDVAGLIGAVTSARFQRTGALSASPGSRFDLEIGINSLSTNGGSYGLLLTNAQNIASTNYSIEWGLPSAFYNDIGARLGGLYELQITDRVSSVCGQSYLISDWPQTNWPLNKDILTAALAADRVIPQGRCRDFLFDHVDAPLNGTWDIVFRGGVIASSGQPNGWNVEDDYTWYGGLTVTAPTNAAPDAVYEVRVLEAGWTTPRSTTFSVVPAGAIITAPVLLPLTLSTNMISAATNITLTVSLDAPAPYNDAHVPIYTNGVFCSVVIIPAGQATTSTNIPIAGSSGSTPVIFASYNGYRKAFIRVVSGTCVTPDQPSPIVDTDTMPGSVLLTWAPIANAASYNVSRGLNGVNFVTLFSGLATNRYVDTTFISGNDYVYQVTAFSNWCSSTGSTNVTAPYRGPAPAPWIIPHGGIYNDQVSVLLTNFVPGTVMFYTTDGSTPAMDPTQSFTNGGIIALTSNATIKAYTYAYLSDGITYYESNSLVVSASFTIVPPTPITCGSTPQGTLTQSNAYSTVSGPGFFSSRFAYNAGSGNVGEYVTVTASSSDFDTVLFVEDGSENVLTWNDDYTSGSTDSQVSFRVLRAGVYVFEVTSYSPGGTGNFSLEFDCQTNTSAGLNVFTNAFPTFTTNTGILPIGGSIDFGTNNAGAYVTNYVTLTNSGNGNLAISNLVVYPSAATNGGNGFSIFPTNAISLPPGGITNLAIVLYSTNWASFSGYFSFTNNDSGNGNNTPQTFFYAYVSGVVTPPPGPPYVSIYYPTNGMTIPATNSSITNVTLEIDAVAMDANSIQKVEFYTNNYPGGPVFQTLTTTPYTVYWTNPPAGIQVITAKAYDNSPSHLSSVTNVTITVGMPVLTLSPTNACVGLSNTTFTVTATLLNVTNGPVTGSNVVFSVTGADTLNHTSTTGTNGQATFTYTNSNAGLDTITATAVVAGVPVQAQAILKNWAGSISCGTTNFGALAATDGTSIACNCGPPSHYTDFYSFTGTSNEFITFKMTSTNFSTFMFFMNSNCAVINITNEALNANNTQFQITLPSNGTYVVEATSADSFQTGSYALSAICGTPTTPNLVASVGSTNIPNYGLLNLGTTTNGMALTATLALTNKGNSTLIISNFSWYYGLTNVFSITPAPVVSLSAGTGTNFTVQFLSTNSGQYADALILTNNDPDENPFVINLNAISNPNGTPPTVSVTAPSNNSVFVAPATINIQANATSASGSTISNVLFLFQTSLGTNLIGSSTTYPYYINWNIGTPGNYNLLAVAYDSQGRIAISSPVTNVQVRPSTQNHPPVAVADYPIVLANSQNNILNVLTNDYDPDGDPLTITQVIPSTTPGPHGTMSIVNNGKNISYTPPPGYGSPDITLVEDGFTYVISDGKGGTNKAGVFVIIFATSLPQIAITNPPAETYLTTGATTNITVSITPPEVLTNIAVVEYFIGDELIGVVTNAPFTNFTWFVQGSPCNCSMKARVIDIFGQLNDSQPVHYNFTIPAGSPVPYAQIFSPAALPVSSQGQSPEAIVEDGLMTVIGSSYQVTSNGITNGAQYDVVIEAEDGTILRDSGWINNAAPILDAPLYTNDLTTLQNDRYQLILYVRNNYQTASQTVPFILQSNLKVGVFSYSEQDLVIPAGGAPLGVVRTYSSMNPNCGDFGYSWIYSLDDFDVTFHETRVQQCPVDGGDDFSLRVAGSRDVTLTLPNGNRTTFSYYEVNGNCNEDDPQQLCVLPMYQSPPDVHYSLQPVDTDGSSIGGYDVFLKVWQKAGGETAHDVYDFPAFLLTDSNSGTQYFIARDYQGEFEFLPDDCGGAAVPYLGNTTDSNFYSKAYGAAHLAWIMLQSGQKIVINPGTFNNGGSQFSIDYLDSNGSTNRSIYFQRNTQGQISAVMDPINGPNGLPVVQYEYDGNTNLSRVIKLTDANGPTYTTNTYLYENGSFPHYLTTILDARGVPAARNLYDDTGKLIGVIDASGKTNLFVYNLSGQTQTVFDRMGNPTIYGYDTRGNITTTIDSLGHETSTTYDNSNNVTSQTDALGNTSYFAYDANGNRTQTIDPLGHTNLFSYDSNGKLLTHTDPLGNLAQNQYDSSGNLTVAVQYDSLSNVVQQSSSIYVNGHLTQLSIGSDVTGTFGYDDSGNLTSSTNADGFSQSFIYDSNGRRTGTSYLGHKPDSTPVTIVTTNTYDASGNVTMTVDGNGNTNQTFYNAMGKVDHTIDAYNNTNSYFYDARGNLIQTISPFGTNSTVFDGNARPILGTDPNGISGTLTQYDPVGNVISTIRASNVVVNIVSDPNNPGQFMSVIGSTGVPYSTNSTEYYNNGWVNSRTGPDGSTTSYQYYADGQTMAVTDALGNTSSYFYDDAGHQTTMVDALNHITRFVYDALGRKTTTVFADGTSVTNNFNDVGQNVAQVDQAGLLTQFAYSVSGLMTNVVKPQVLDPENGNNPANPQWNYQYDVQGHLMVITDPKGRSTTNTFDEFGRQASHSFTMGETSSNLYNARGQLWKQYDCKGQWTEFVYDNYGRTKAKFLFNAGATYPSNSVCYQYDQLGRLAHVVERYDQDASTNSCDGYTAMVGPPGGSGGGNGLMALLVKVPKDVAGGVTAVLLLALALASVPREKRRLLALCMVETWRDYCRLGQEVRPVKRLRLASSGWRFTAVVALMALISNDPNLERFWMARAQCSIPSNASTLTTRYTDLTYDTDGHITQVSTPEGVINYGYDMATGRETNICTANSYVAYGYDALGRLKTVTVSKRNGVSITPETTTYTFDAAGNRATVTLPNNIVATWKYDALNRLTNLTQVSGTTNIASYSYQLQATGRRTNAVEILRQEDGTYQTNTLTWQYDGMYRLTNEVQISSATGGTYTNAFEYDLVGNRYEQIRTAGSTITIITNLYNANDQLLQEVTNFNGSITGTNSYGYDANGSVTGLTNASGTITYAYNLANQMSSITSGGSATSYQYNDSGIRVRAVTGANTTYYLVDANNHTGYAQVLEELNTVGGTPITSYVLGDDVLGQCGTTATAPLYRLADGHGSTRQMANLSGGVTSHYSYEAYGLTQPTSTASAETSKLYCGEQYDSTLQMYNLRARYYDPSNGRFNAVDTYAGNNSDPQSLHKYNYTYSDPINGTDPSGHDLVELLCVTAIQTILTTIRVVALGALIGAGVGAVAGAAISGYLSILQNESFEGLGHAMLSGALLGAIQGAIIGASAVNPVALAVTLGFMFGINLGTSLQVLGDPTVNKQTKVAIVLLLVLQGWLSIRGIQSRIPAPVAANPLTASLRAAFNALKAKNTALLGWIEPSGNVKLLPVGDGTPFNGHLGAQAAGIIPPGSRGFSIIVDEAGRVKYFSSQSGLNDSLPNSALPAADAAALLEALPMADNPLIWPVDN